MNSKQLQYAIVLADTRSFSLASEKLKISQPALSKQILHLENELGIKLFDRNTVPFTITPAGDYFIGQAKKLLFQEDQLLSAVNQFKTGEKGRLSIGISPFRNLSWMPKMLHTFRQRYPGVQVNLHETNSDQLRKDAAEGKYDFAIVNLPVDEAILDIIPLKPESPLLAVPTSLVSLLPASSDPAGLDFSDCCNLPFVVVAQSQEMRRCFDSLCAQYNVTPNISVEVSGGITTAWAMAKAGLGATLLPSQFPDTDSFTNNLMFFRIKGAPFSRQPVIVTRRDQYLSVFAQYAISLLSDSL